LKIILHYDDYKPDDPAAQIIIEWITGKTRDKAPDNISPLRYVDLVEVEA
jgi:hypothetical protein